MASQASRELAQIHEEGYSGHKGASFQIDDLSSLAEITESVMTSQVREELAQIHGEGHPGHKGACFQIDNLPSSAEHAQSAMN